MDDDLLVEQDVYEHVPLSKRVNCFEKIAEHEKSQLSKPSKHSGDYGRPIEGSKTQLRGLKAHSHVSNEVKYCCEIIRDNGQMQPDGTVIITFGLLFDIYTRISDKLVGMLLRARKHGFVHFDGEILYQGRDNNVPITLIKMPPKDLNFGY